MRPHGLKRPLRYLIMISGISPCFRWVTYLARMSLGVKVKFILSAVEGRVSVVFASLIRPAWQRSVEWQIQPATT